MFHLDGSETSWLIYCDWLEDQGINAQYIRWQLEDLKIVKPDIHEEPFNRSVVGPNDDYGCYPDSNFNPPRLLGAGVALVWGFDMTVGSCHLHDAVGDAHHFSEGVGTHIWLCDSKVADSQCCMDR